MYSKVTIHPLECRPNIRRRPYFVIELIGEEIYDEFDPEGAYGDRYPYESQAQSRDGGSPETHRPSNNQRPQSAMGASNQWNSLATPTALASSLKGIAFSRTRSAPPIPRETETDKHVPNDKLTGTKWDKMNDEKDSVHFFSETDPGHTFLGTTIQMPKPIKGTGKYPPSVILEQHSTISSYESNSAIREDIPVSSVEGKELTLPPTQQKVPSVMVTTPALTRLGPSASILSPQLPAIQTTPTTLTTNEPPTLEAILLERKRRLSATAGNTASNSSTPGPDNNHTSVPSSPVLSGFGLSHKFFGASGGPPVLSTSGSSGVALRGVHTSGKGSMFKSSPLGSGDRVKATKKSEDVQRPGQEQGENHEVEKVDLAKDIDVGDITQGR